MIFATGNAPRQRATEIVYAEDYRALRTAADKLADSGSYLLDCANGIVGADADDPDAQDALDMFDEARRRYRADLAAYRALIQPKEDKS